MAPSFVQSTEDLLDSTSATEVLAFDSPVTAGNMIFVAMSWEDVAGTNTMSCADDKGNSYHQIGSYARDTTDKSYFALFYAWAVNVGVTTVTLTQNVSSRFRRLILVEYAGVRSTSDPLDQSSTLAMATSSAGVDATSATSITPTAAGCLVVSAFNDTAGVTTIVAGTNFALREETGSGGTLGGPTGVEDLVQAVAAPIAPKWTLGTGGHLYEAFAVSFLPAGRGIGSFPTAKMRSRRTSW